MRRWIWLLLLVACDELVPTTDGTNQSASDAGAAATTATTATAFGNACQGFVDITGACYSVACFETAACTPAVAPGCSPGASGAGECLGGYCLYALNGPSCAAPSDCACGLCGADGACYTDPGGGCGACGAASTSDAGVAVTNTSATTNAGCVQCLTACSGVGPTCGSGAGGLCEAACATAN